MITTLMITTSDTLVLMITELSLRFSASLVLMFARLRFFGGVVISYAQLPIPRVFIMKR
jgi:hypothetical protein